jgi:hypothetical protein
MRLLTLLLAITLLQSAPQDEKKKATFDPFADPAEELAKRADTAAKEKTFNELKGAAIELRDLSKMISDEIEAGGKDVISAKLGSNLDRAEKLIKTIREKSK